MGHGISALCDSAHCCKAEHPAQALALDLNLEPSALALAEALGFLWQLAWRFGPYIPYSAEKELGKLERNKETNK